LIVSNPQADDAVEAALQGSPGTPRQPSLDLDRHWRSPPDRVTLSPAYRQVDADGAAVVEIALGDHRLRLDQPVLLEPEIVPKPWGREIWHTGIEARGESRVRTNAGTLPVSQYLTLAPHRLTGSLPLVLLKILDPRPEPVLGDLYFETHERKQEVYVVTHVDPEAWPDGRGRIRFGMNQALRARYGDDDRFRADYLEAVRRYERVRRAIDAGEAVPDGDEAARRAAMEAFTELRELAVGDVVVVPTWLPHSLQHGVRVIEFQTPTYERYIISFAQRVLTQNHWDTDKAVANMRLDAPPPPRFDAPAAGIERIVGFDDFRAWRMTLAAGESRLLPAHPGYLLCMAVTGRVGLDGLALDPEQAAFVPGEALRGPRREHSARLRNDGSEPAVLLIAAPDL
jgi:hypothetical protein